MSRSVKIKCCRNWGFARMHAQKYRRPQKRRAEKCLKPGTARKTVLAMLKKNQRIMLPKLWFRAHASPKNPQAEKSRFLKNTIFRSPTHRRESLRNAGSKHEKHQNMGNNPRQNRAPWPATTSARYRKRETTQPEIEETRKPRSHKAKKPRSQKAEKPKTQAGNRKKTELK